MTDQERTDFFNLHFDEINHELDKRKNKWQLKAIPSIEFLDVKQIILFHVFKKIHLYNGEKSPFVNWLNSLISNQISNLLRNNFYAISRPCLKCACVLPSDGCELYETQCEKCVLFKHWVKTKKAAHDIRLPLPQENHTAEVFDIPGQEFDYITAEKRLHEEMFKCLKKPEWTVYEMIYIFHLSDSQVAKKMRWVSSEGRPAGYGNLARLKKIFLQKAKKIRDEIDLF